MPLPDAIDRFHRRWPGAMGAALARGRTEDGRGSYLLLAEQVTAGERVLEVGCGDGALLAEVRARGGRALGIDLAAAELAWARRRGEAVVRADAAALPLATASVDVVLSHLALSVMAPLDEVVAELARVLAPGGRVVALAGGGPAVRPTPEAFDLFLDALRGALRGRPRKRLGDGRADHPRGWRELWEPHGYRVEWHRHELDFSGAFEEVWRSLFCAYELCWLSDDELEALRAELADACAAAFGERVPMTMVTYLAIARSPEPKR